MISYTNSNQVSNDVIIKEYFIRVLDYDGTIIDEKYMHNGEIYTLPSAPSHTGLVFKEWSSTQEIFNNKIIVKNNNILVGAIYYTSSGKSEFDVMITERSGSSFTLNMDGTKDWGDGTSDTLTTHTYAIYGEYTIKCNGTVLNTHIESSYVYGVFNQNSNTSNRNGTVTSIRLSNNITNIPAGAFINCQMLSNIILPSIESVGDRFVTGNNLSAVILPNSLQSLGILNCSARYVIIPKTVVITNTQYFFQNSYASEYIIIDHLDIDKTGSSSFYYNHSLKRIDLPSTITQINSSSFSYCTSLSNIIIPENVNLIEANAFNTCSSILDYDFTHVKSVPTLGNTSAFTGINSLAKIRVPWNLYEKWITETNWSTYADYIYAGDPAIVNFDIYPHDVSPEIYVNSELITGTSIECRYSEFHYTIYDRNNDILLSKAIGLSEGMEVTITEDLTSSANRLNLLIGVSGLNITFDVYGIVKNAIEDNGNYYIDLISDNTNIDYYIDGGNNYFDYEGSILTTGSDVTEVVNLTPCEVQSFIRPNLTANGTLGGDAFAVSAEAYSTSTSYQAWRAVDSSTSTSYYWYSKSGGGAYIFYNPDKIKVTRLTYKYTSTAYRATSVTIQGSNDNVNWTNITSSYSGSSTTYTSTLTNNIYYNYYKLTFTPYSSYVRIYDMLITATIKVPV